MAGETTANAPGKAETDPEDTTAETGDGAKAAEARDGKKEEQEEECGFCKRAGRSCKTAFVAWEDCVDKAKEADRDVVEKCAKQTEALRDCMLADDGVVRGHGSPMSSGGRREKRHRGVGSVDRAVERTSEPSLVVRAGRQAASAEAAVTPRLRDEAERRAVERSSFA